MASIKDVAKRAGVSVATVSRVINDAGNVKVETKTAVETAMKELHYYPNDLARALGKTKRSKIIALFSMAPHQPFFAELIGYIEAALYKKGYRLLLLTSEKDVLREKKCSDLVNSRVIDGLIIGSFPVVKERFLELDLPMVTIETALSETMPSVRSDNYQGGIIGTRHLIAKGCKNLVLINGKDDDLSVERKMDGREKGFLQVCGQEGVNYRIYYTESDMVWSLNYSSLANRLFYEFPEVDGILANSDLIAAEMVQAGIAQGYRVPENLKIVGFDGTKISRILNPPLTVVVQNIRGLAENAVNTLIDEIEGREYALETILPVNLLERKTT